MAYWVWVTGDPPPRPTTSPTRGSSWARKLSVRPVRLPSRDRVTASVGEVEFSRGGGSDKGFSCGLIA